MGRQRSGGNATTEEFIAYAEEVSGQRLDELFDTWLYTARKPAPWAVSPAGRARLRTARARARAKARLGQLQWRLAMGRYRPELIESAGQPEALEERHDLVGVGRVLRPPREGRRISQLRGSGDERSYLLDLPAVQREHVEGER